MPRVAVLGAGASGLKAAFDLSRGGADVVVFEAEERTGGRVRTVEVAGEAVDFGAESFEAGVASKWIEEFTELLILPPDIEWISPYAKVREAAWWWPDGALVRTHSDQIAGTPAALRVEETFERNIEAGLDVAVATGVDLGDLAARYAYAVSGSGAFSEAIEPSFYSAQDRARNTSPGDDARPFVDGEPYGVGRLFGLYADCLASQPRVEIRVASRVDEITPQLDRGWTLRVDDDRDSFDALIVTASVDVITRPDFPLPRSIGQQVRAAFAGIELGAYTKLALHWPSATTALGKEAMLGFYVGQAGLPAWQVSKLRDSEVVLLALAGSRARDLDEPRTTQQAIDVVRAITGVDTRPTRAVISRWNSSPSFRGAYSYTKVGAGPARPGLQSSLLDLYAPVGLHFAGEAFSVPLYGSLEATWTTGADAAARCLRVLGLE
ncbi:MAG: FAD-dependent oxidoreductase [Myxococcales bacterium]|nr:FAD-dependent oxidoreductase [Myxococcales bacterium]